MSDNSMHKSLYLYFVIKFKALYLLTSLSKHCFGHYEIFDKKAIKIHFYL